MFMSTGLCFKLRPDLNFNDEEIAECLFIEIYRPKGNIIVGVVYRPAEKNIHSFIDTDNGILDKIALKNKRVYIMVRHANSHGFIVRLTILM